MNNTLIYNNSASIAEINGKRIVSGIKPNLSFAYDELQYHQTNKGYLIGTDWFNMTNEQEIEVENYILSITVDEILSQKIQDNNTHLAYLYNTDWYVTRFSETGVAIPNDITTQRAIAREAIEDLSNY